MIDSHAHPYLCKTTDIDTFVTAAHDAGVKRVVCVGTGLQTSLKGLELSKHYSLFVPTLGLHPCEARSFDQLDQFEALLDTHAFKAIGETGLDYYWDTSFKALQHQAFRRQLQLAQQYQLPVILHSREANEDTAAVIADFPDVKRVFHCYSGTPEFAQSQLNGYTYFSFTGAITFSKRGKTIRSIEALPLDRMMIETDCPYLTPAAYKGQENQSAYVGEVAHRIAEIKQISVGEVIEQTTQNAISFFNL